MNMKEQDKQLLLKDLCTRLPYGVKVKSSRRQIVVTLSLDIMTDFHLGCTVKPYLRSMSSMTEEEKEELRTLKWTKLEHYTVDWLNEHHFDYRGLIEKGLALEAPEGMYKTE